MFVTRVVIRKINTECDENKELMYCQLGSKGLLIEEI